MNTGPCISVERQIFQKQVIEVIKSGVLIGRPVILKILWYPNKYVVETNYHV